MTKTKQGQAQQSVNSTPSTLLVRVLSRAPAWQCYIFRRGCMSIRIKTHYISETAGLRNVGQFQQPLSVREDITAFFWPRKLQDIH
jgi:hypothetical protein